MVIRIGLIARDAHDMFARTLPTDSEGIWAGRKFSAFTEGERYDWIVVVHWSLNGPVDVVGDPRNVAYVSLEPQEIRPFRPRFFDQFGRVVATDPSLRHPGLVRRTGMGWWVGIGVDYDEVHRRDPGVRLTYDDLVRMPVPSKARRVSVVTSTARRFPGHVARDRLLAEILSHPIARHIDIHGGGRNPVRDKWDAIAPARYHLALENCSMPDYWTEKLSDAFLGFSLPLYFGCTNLDEYFPAGSFERIDAFRPADAIRSIERVLDEDPWEHRLPDIIEARRRVLDDHHPLSVLARVCDRPATEVARFTLRPWDEFPLSRARVATWTMKRAVFARTLHLTIGGRPLWRLPPA